MVNGKKIKNKKILVIDDDPIITAMFFRILSAEGFDILIADSGVEFVNELGGIQFDIIFIDVLMSWISGISLCRLIRQNTFYKNTKIIIISGMGGEKDIRTGYEAGCNQYLVKPISSDLLIKTVESMYSINRINTI